MNATTGNDVINEQSEISDDQKATLSAIYRLLLDIAALPMFPVNEETVDT